MWLAHLTNSSMRQRHAVTIIRNAGGVVYYDWMLEPIYNADGEVDYYKVIEDANSMRAPQWLRKLTGDDFFQRVVTVTSLEIGDIDEDVYAALRTFTCLREVTLASSSDDASGSTASRIDEVTSRIQNELGVVVSGPFPARQ